MPKFIYKGGNEPTKFNDEDNTGKMPAEITAFGIEFLRGQPARVEASMFRTPELYSHALMKLRGNRFFEEVKIEDAKFEEVAPDKAPEPKKRGPKPKAVRELEALAALTEAAE